MKALRELAGRWRRDAQIFPDKFKDVADAYATELESALDTPANPAEVGSKLAETPETDAVYRDIGGDDLCMDTDMDVVFDHARRLERERDEARRHAQFWRNIHCDDCDTADKNLFPWEQ